MMCGGKGSIGVGTGIREGGLTEKASKCTLIRLHYYGAYIGRKMIDVAVTE